MNEHDDLGHGDIEAALATRRELGARYDAELVDGFAERIERAVEAWVDAMVERPTLARLILRHAAEVEEHPTQIMFPAVERLLRGVARKEEEPWQPA